MKTITLLGIDLSKQAREYLSSFLAGSWSSICAPSRGSQSG